MMMMMTREERERQCLVGDAFIALFSLRVFVGMHVGVSLEREVLEAVVVLVTIAVLDEAVIMLELQ